MKFNKAMTKFLSALIMASMVGTSVQIPTLAEITNAGQAIVDGVKDNNVKDTEGSTESKDTAAAGDEDNKESKDAEAEKEAASNNAANNANAGGSRGEGRTSSSSAYNNSSSSSSDTTQVLQPFSTENDSKELWFDIMGQSKQLQLPPQMVTVMILYGKLNRNSFHFQSRESKATRVPSILLGTAKQ